MTDIVRDATKLRDQAAPRNRQHKQVELYWMLADCMALAERCMHNPAEYDELKKAFIAQTEGSKRRYIESKTSAYGLVCRFVFHSGPNSNRVGAWRYAKALDEAAKRQLNSATLFDYLNKNGGIGKLFLERDTEKRTRETRVLNLTSPIVVEKGGTITLTLTHSHGPVFDVVAVSGISEAAA